ncbi:MAG TPA: hypothetical protein VMU27_00925 [Candidatus Paceibacterota bacterium]|nr:hypothetical protein [Candidatus Paceibacterota bacterium]
MFGSSHSSERIIAIADIGNGNAGIALVKIKKHEPARIIASERLSLPFEDRTSEAAARGIVTALGQVAEKILAKHSSNDHKHMRIAGVYAVVHAPWALSKVVQARSSFSEESRITNGMINALAQQTIANSKELDKSNLMESAVVRVELNGYPTSSPIGKTAHELSLAILVSQCDPQVKTGAEEALGRSFPGFKPVFRSAERTLMSVLRALPKSTEDYVLLDMQEEASDIIAVRGGLTVAQAVVHEGTHTILKRLFEKGLPEESLSLIRMLERDECSTEACEAIKTAMAKTEIELSKTFGDTFIQIAVPLRLPADLILIAQADLTPWLSRFFTRIDFTQCTVTAQPFSVHGLTSENLAPFAVYETDGTGDIGFVVAGALVNIEENA